MPDEELLKFLASLGVGGIIAGLMFVFYRKDIKFYTDQWKGQTELMIKVVIDNTKSITQNTEVTNALHRRLDTDAREDYDKARSSNKSNM